jgi:8-oxo-dGTP diphosphatase
MPRSLRRWSMRLLHTRFTVTAGGIVVDSRGRVLLLKHRFRGGSGWGIPGGFIEANEQAHEAIKRELLEEVGLEVEVVRILKARTFEHARQIEILFLCRTNDGSQLGKTKTVEPQSPEIKTADWFSLDGLPEGLPNEQKLLLRNTVLTIDD